MSEETQTVGTEGTAMTEITAALKDDNKQTVKETTILFDFGGSVERAIEMFGADVVYTNFVRASKVTAQAALRALMEKGLTDEDIQSKMDAWKPGVALERTVDPVAALLAKFGKMPAEEQAKLLADLQSRANG